MDTNSKAMLELVSTNRSLEDVNLFLANELKENRIDLDLYMKKLKENIEREYNNKHIMNKIFSGTFNA